MALGPFSIKNTQSLWTIKVVENLSAKRTLHENWNILNENRTSKICLFKGCSTILHSSNKRGLCQIHKIHQHTLVTELISNNVNFLPVHLDIVDYLIEWSSRSKRAINLQYIFIDIANNILGNIPDVTTLAGETTHNGISIPTLKSLINNISLLVDKHLPDSDSASYELVSTDKGQIPAKTLLLTFSCLMLCEEANRGDRWFNKVVRKNESLTQMLGGAMPIGYYAAKSFPWGIIMSKSSVRKFVPR